MYKIANRTFKEIDNRYTMICIEDVEAIVLNKTKLMDEYDRRKYWLEFILENGQLKSKCFNTEEEAIKFRDEIMGWDDDK